MEYLDVKDDPSALARMLSHSGGKRLVPVIVEGERITVGHGGT